MERKADYQRELDAILSGLRETSRRPSLLLHACCGPCSSYVVEYLAERFAITILYYNPNIFPQEEYSRRLHELKDFLARFPPAAAHNIRLVEAPYDPEEFYAATNVRNEPELQQEPERGERCRRCYGLRMRKSYEYARAHGFDYFTTTLSISPHKDAAMINTIGKALICPGETEFLPADFKKRNGYLRSLQLSREYGLYRQDYCGCAYSKKNSGGQG